MESFISSVKKLNFAMRNRQKLVGCLHEQPKLNEVEAIVGKFRTQELDTRSGVKTI